eukprot:1848418-Pyramimonas_sp.AAC.1
MCPTSRCKQVDLVFYLLCERPVFQAWFEPAHVQTYVSVKGLIKGVQGTYVMHSNAKAHYAVVIAITLIEYSSLIRRLIKRRTVSCTEVTY